MAAPTPMNLTVPAGNISFSVRIRSQLAERAAYWRQQWTIEKDSKKKVFNNRAIPTKGQPKSEKMKMHLQAPYALFLLGNISNFIISSSFL